MNPLYEDPIKEIAHLNAVIEAMEQKLKRSKAEFELACEALERCRGKAGEFRCSHGPYKVWGTNDCNECMDGRITLYYLNGLCTECQHKRDKVQEGLDAQRAHDHARMEALDQEIKESYKASKMNGEGQ